MTHALLKRLGVTDVEILPFLSQTVPTSHGPLFFGKLFTTGNNDEVAVNY